MYRIRRIRAWLFGMRTGNWSCHCPHCGSIQLEILGCVNIECPNREKKKC